MNEEGVTQAAPGWGNLYSPVVIVGQSLCEQCMKPQEPFFEGSGSLLNEGVRLAGRAKGKTFISNVVHCHPPKNRGSREHEIVNCSSYLHRELELVRRGWSSRSVSTPNVFCHSSTPRRGSLRGRSVRRAVGSRVRPTCFSPSIPPGSNASTTAQSNRNTSTVWPTPCGGPFTVLPPVLSPRALEWPTSTQRLTNRRDTIFASLSTIKCRFDGRHLDRGRRARLGLGPRSSRNPLAHRIIRLCQAMSATRVMPEVFRTPSSPPPSDIARDCLNRHPGYRRRSREAVVAMCYRP